MHPVDRPRWQQMTALVSLGTGGAMTAFSLVPASTAADLTSPTSAHIRLLALQQAARPAVPDERPLRSAIVNVANYYLRMAQGKTPAEMEALIWQRDSIDGVDHGASCAAFASLTLELAAQVVGQQSWVTGGTSYPWPLHPWADVRVDPNPASPGIISILQDAEAHGRWHPLGDGYEPQPGDWVLFDGHVEVVTKDAGGVLHTIGADSLPNMSVNAHAYPAPLAAQGVVGFVNNGELAAAPSRASGRGAPGWDGHRADGQVQDWPGVATGLAHTGPAEAGLAAIPAAPIGRSSAPAANRPPRGADVAAFPVTGSASGHRDPARRPARPGWERDAHVAPRPDAPEGADQARADVPATGRSAPTVTVAAARRGAASIPGLTMTRGRADLGSVPTATRYRRYQPPSIADSAPATEDQQAFIREVVPGALATQHRYGVPAAVTIAQAIDESGWGSSYLATQDHNLFGIKGNGPAGTVVMPTQEYENGQPVSQIASFRVYRNIAQSIDDHGRLLATSGYYGPAMAQAGDPNAFAAALTGTYATNPEYGAQLIGLMQRYDLYRYDQAAPAPPAGARAHHTHAHGAPASGRRAAPAPPDHAPGYQATAGAPASARSPSARPPLGAPSPGATVTTPSAPGPARHPSAFRRPAASDGTPAEPLIPGLPRRPAGPAAAGAPQSPRATSPGRTAPTAPERQRGQASPATQAVSAKLLAASANGTTAAAATAGGGRAHVTVTAYAPHIPAPVQSAFRTTARSPLTRAAPLYRDVAAGLGIGWQLLAACDWMECRAHPRYSPVHGEKLGTVNPDGTVYRTKSAALRQCADDLVTLARTVYRIDLAAPGHLSVRDLANAFAAFRWGGLLKIHRTSAMEFPYSVAGLTDQHLHMRWPRIDEPNAPDKPGSRFRMPFGAVPVVLGLGYPAAV